MNLTSEPIGYKRPVDGDHTEFWVSKTQNSVYSEPLYTHPADGAVEPASDLVERLRHFDVANFDLSEELGKWLRENAELRREAAAALTALQQRAETLERELTEARLDFTKFNRDAELQELMRINNEVLARAESAEQRNREALAIADVALREINFTRTPRMFPMTSADIATKALADIAALADQPAGAEN